MSDYFPGHPLPDTTYNITVVAVNEGGRGITNAPACMYICLLLHMYNYEVHAYVCIQLHKIANTLICMHI